MAHLRSYRDLVVWRKAIELVKQVYALTAEFPANERYGLSDQVRRAAVFVPSNIAEGQGRQLPGEFMRFLRIALGSLAELDTQLLIAVELGYLNPQAVQPTNDLILEIRKMLYTLIQRLNPPT